MSIMIQKIARMIWRLNPTKKGIIHDLAFPCNCSHTFSAPIHNASWFYNGSKQGPIESLLIEGCYKCGKIKVRDFEA